MMIQCIKPAAIMPAKTWFSYLDFLGSYVGKTTQAVKGLPDKKIVIVAIVILSLVFWSE